MHKRIRLTPLDRREMWRLWQRRDWKLLALSTRYRVSRLTVYKILERTRKQEFVPRKSEDIRFKSLKLGLKRLAKIERNLEERRNQEARRDNT